MVGTAEQADREEIKALVDQAALEAPSNCRIAEAMQARDRRVPAVNLEGQVMSDKKAVKETFSWAT